MRSLKATIYDKKGRVLSVGTNKYLKTHPEQAYYANRIGGVYVHKVFLHAEIDALVKVKFGKPYRIFVERYGKDGRPMNAKPCPICELAIKEAGIQRVEYTI